MIGDTQLVRVAAPLHEVDHAVQLPASIQRDRIRHALGIAAPACRDAEPELRPNRLPRALLFRDTLQPAA